MCSPTLAVSAGISLAQESKRAKGVNEQIESGQKLAVDNFNRSVKNTQDELALQVDQFEQSQFFQAIDLAKANSASQVAFSASGVSGISQDRVLNDLEMQNTLKTNVQEKNLQTASRRADANIQSAFLNTNQQIKNLQSQTPSLFDSALNITGGTLSLGTSLTGVQNQLAQNNNTGG